ncbi:hypothetical protein ACWDKQ_25565 [Saccharopolyspora sp. NPDC000995]
MLVERSTSSLRLTDAGQWLRWHAHQILNHLHDAVAEAAAGPRSLRVGFAWAALGRHTVPLLRQWHREHPDVPLQMRRVNDRGALSPLPCEASSTHLKRFRAVGVMRWGLGGWPSSSIPCRSSPGPAPRAPGGVTVCDQPGRARGWAGRGLPDEGVPA